MRWRPRFEGLRLEVPLGWTELASHVADDDIARLLDLLVAHAEGPLETLELEWADVESGRVGRLHANMLVAVRCPASLGESEREAALARLGQCRGMFRKDVGGHWPSPLWDEREIKAPLAMWLLGDLRRTDHALAQLGIKELPVELLAGMTSEPIEFLDLVEQTLDHRLEFARFGVGAEDWMRSAKLAIAGRLGRRFAGLEKPLVAQIFEALLQSPPEGLRVVGIERECAQLVRLGLAWDGGDDIALASLARAVKELDLLGALIARIRNVPWGPRARQRMETMLPPEIVPLRMAVTAPEYPYAQRPVVFKARPLGNVLEDCVKRGDDAGLAILATLLVIHEGGTERLDGLRAFGRALTGSSEGLHGWATQAARYLEAVARVGWGALRKDVDWPADSQEGNFIAFVELLAVEVAWSVGPDQFGEAYSHLERVLAGVSGDRSLVALLQVVLGDLAAMTLDYEIAVNHWSRAEEFGGESDGDDSLLERKLFASLRRDVNDMDEFARAGARVFEQSPSGQTLTLLFIRALSTVPGSTFDSPEHPHNQFKDFARQMRTSRALQLARWDEVLDEAPSLALDEVERRRQGMRVAWARLAIGDLDGASEDIDGFGDDVGDGLIESMQCRITAFRARLVGDDAEFRDSTQWAMSREDEMQMNEVVLLAMQWLVASPGLAIPRDVNDVFSKVSRNLDVLSVTLHFEMQRMNPLLAAHASNAESGVAWVRGLNSVPPPWRTDPRLLINIEHLIDAAQQAAKPIQDQLHALVDEFSEGIADPVVSERLRERLRMAFGLAERDRPSLT